MIEKFVIRENPDYKVVLSIENGQVGLRLFNLAENRVEARQFFNKDEVINIINFLKDKNFLVVV